MRYIHDFILLIAGILVLPCGGQTPFPCVIECTTQDEHHQVNITWESIPTHHYNVLVKTELEQPWSPLNPQPLRASLNSMRYQDNSGECQRFYCVLDLNIPANLVWIPPGTFTMGTPLTERVRDQEEGPQTQVTISQGFWMGRYEVTQAEFEAVMGYNPSWRANQPQYPVEQVSWALAGDYCRELTSQAAQARTIPPFHVYRLPTEAEWEYACRAGTTTAFYHGDIMLSGMANFWGLYEYNAAIGIITNQNGTWLGRTTAVGNYAPNPWGLYDMHGNVNEWVQDWWSPNLPGGSVVDPTGAPNGAHHVFRGGSGANPAHFCRSGYRGDHTGNLDPNGPFSDIGFRVVLSSQVPPYIVEHPQSQTVRVGEDVTFTVAVTNTAVLPVGYRWRKGFATVHVEALHATTSSFTITNVQSSHAGRYSVAVTNAAYYTPGYLSDTATLTVLEE